MNLPSKSSAPEPRAGYAMAALLIAMSVMAIMLSIAMPAWSHLIRREKEEELIFRGEQYARAINQYQRKYANQSPPTIDVLIEQRFLRKKFKDPLSPDKDGEFQLLSVQTQMPSPGQGAAQGPGGQSRGTVGTARGSGSSDAGGRGTAPGIGSGIGPMQAGRGGPIVGVASKNTGESIRLYKGKNRYNEWQFIGMEMSTTAGGGPGGAPGERGAGGGARRGGGPGDSRGGRSGDRRSGPTDGGSSFPPTPRGGPGPR